MAEFHNFFFAPKLKGVNGIQSGDIKKLMDAGYHTIESVAYSLKKNIAAIKNISEIKADKLVTEAMKFVDMGFKTASVVAQARGKSQLIVSYRY